MSLVVALVAVVAVTLLFTLFVRPQDIPPPDPVSPTRHLDERKAAVYENLRDLQFEYRVGKLSDADYAKTKLALQKELAVVVAETERVLAASAPASSQPASVKPGSAKPASANAASAKSASAKSASTSLGSTKPVSAKLASAAPKAASICPHCGAEFATPLKFCGECGKEMS